MGRSGSPKFYDLSAPSYWIVPVFDPSMDQSVACRFFGGPWDGKTVMREDAPLRLIVPQLGEVRIGPDGPEEVVPQRDVMYRRRGPVVTGTADYEEVTDG